MNSGVLNKIYLISSTVTNLAYINILWLCFIFLGGGIFGIFPATVAMFMLIKKLMFEKEDINILKEFTLTFKREFKKSNQLFFPYTLLGIIIIADIRFITTMDFTISNLVVKLFNILLFLLIVVFLYSLVGYNDDEIGKKEIFKSSIYMLVHTPLTNLFILTGICVMYLLTSKVVGLFFLFSGSLFSLFTIFVVNNSAKKIFIKDIDTNR